ncbi:PD-(D/E)XK nuclease family protein [Candidatus Woesearchaeota archaeon]|nr:PD-(D/E)XK nuclease family protein [Candidatus Woesearchaeota archaeon]
MTRVESAHSISMFKQCRRKYFYKYKLELPEKKGIAAINGQVVHAALEEFFNMNLEQVNELNFEEKCKIHLFGCFSKAWVAAIPELKEVQEEKITIRKYYEDSLAMLQNFSELFIQRVKKELMSSSFQQAFNKWKPESEVYILSEKHQIQGYIDAIHKRNGEVLILDYKTSRKADMTEEYKRQLAIYGLLYKEKFGVAPQKVGLYFLRHNEEKFMDVNEALLEDVKKECASVHKGTASEDIGAYPKNLGVWCRYCDFQTVCFGQKSLQGFMKKEEAPLRV